jgi:hypothetical protein
MRAWWIAGLWLVASCGRPAGEGGEGTSPVEQPMAAPAQGERGQGQPAALQAQPMEPEAAQAPGSQPAALAPGSQPVALAPGSQPVAQAPGSQPVAAQPSAAPQAARLAPDPILAAQQAVPFSEQQDVPVSGELRLAMEEFAEALREHDAVRVLGKFSQSGGFRYADTRKSEPSVRPIPFDRLERELKAKSGLYRALLAPAGLTQYVSGNNALPWRGVGPDEFSPRGFDAKKVWVRWRAEGEAWVVDTIALPAAIPR